MFSGCPDSNFPVPTDKLRCEGLAVREKSILYSWPLTAGHPKEGALNLSVPPYSEEYKRIHPGTLIKEYGTLHQCTIYKTTINFAIVGGYRDRYAGRACTTSLIHNNDNQPNQNNRLQRPKHMSPKY